MRDLHRAAGLDLATDDATTLVTAITGIVHIALTTPDAIGVHEPEDVVALVRRAATLIHDRLGDPSRR